MALHAMNVHLVLPSSVSVPLDLREIFVKTALISVSLGLVRMELLVLKSLEAMSVFVNLVMEGLIVSKVG